MFYTFSGLNYYWWIDLFLGIVAVKSGRVIDREAYSAPVLNLTLVAEDIGRLNSTATLILAILDANDNRPVFSAQSVNVRLRENSPPGEFFSYVCNCVFM